MADKKPDVKEKIEEKYLMLQLLKTQIKELETEIPLLQQRFSELNNMKSSLSELAAIKQNAKTFSSLRLGIYAESETKNTKEVLVNVGAGVLIKKQLAEANEMLAKQIEHTEAILTQLTQNFAALANRASDIEQEIINLVK